MFLSTDGALLDACRRYSPPHNPPTLDTQRERDHRRELFLQPDRGEITNMCSLYRSLVAK